MIRLRVALSVFSVLLFSAVLFLFTQRGHQTLLDGAIAVAFFTGLVLIIFEFCFMRKFGLITWILEEGTKYIRTGLVPYRRLPPSRIYELNHLTQVLEEFRAKIEVYNKQAGAQAAKIAQSNKQAALAELAHQVAHDIRSPLNALAMITASIEEIPPQQRHQMQSALTRVMDISNTMVDRARKIGGASIPTLPLTESPIEKSEYSVENVWLVLEHLVSEKRIQYSDKANLQIESNAADGAHMLAAKVHSRDFKRVLSNLLDNAVEALDQGGTISVAVTAQEKTIALTLTDTGKGIPAELLPELGKRGATFGKENGSGLGLFHAKTKLEEWGGSIAISSEPGKGTEITLQLPLVSEPAWFVKELRLPDNATIVVVDDESSVHASWSEKLSPLLQANPNLKIKFFATAKNFMTWFQADDRATKIFLLCDYELAKEPVTGVQVIQAVRSGFLVTNRYDDPMVRSSGIPVLPKNLIPKVPVHIVS